MEGLIIGIITGILAGFIASKLQSGTGKGLLIDLFLGIIGGMFGGWLFSLLGISDTEQNVMIATIVVFIIGLISGIHGLAGQQRLADYYIQAHLYFLKG